MDGLTLQYYPLRRYSVYGMTASTEPGFQHEANRDEPCPFAATESLHGENQPTQGVKNALSQVQKQRQRELRTGPGLDVNPRDSTSGNDESVYTRSIGTPSANIDHSGDSGQGTNGYAKSESYVDTAKVLTAIAIDQGGHAEVALR